MGKKCLEEILKMVGGYTKKYPLKLKLKLIYIKKNSIPFCGVVNNQINVKYLFKVKNKGRRTMSNCLDC